MFIYPEREHSIDIVYWICKENNLTNCSIRVKKQLQKLALAVYTRVKNRFLIKDNENTKVQLILKCSFGVTKPKPKEISVKIICPKL